MDYYVSPKNGNDAASGSRTNAWRSIGRALKAASSGDIIYVMGPLVVGKDILKPESYADMRAEVERKDNRAVSEELSVHYEGGIPETLVLVADENGVEEAVRQVEGLPVKRGQDRPPGKVPKEDRTFPDLSGKRPDPEARLVGYATQEQIDEHMAGVRKPEM